MDTNNKNKTAKELKSGIAAVIILTICLCVTTFALIYSIVTVDNNFFDTGNIKINLNDGKPVIEEHEFIFEPGMTVKKDFFIHNQSSCDVYYKLYFENVKGGLSDVIEVTVKDGEKTLYSDNTNKLTKTSVAPADDYLRMNEKRQLTVYFYFPENAGNKAQNLTLSFDMCADAVQTKNNPQKQF